MKAGVTRKALNQRGGITLSTEQLLIVDNVLGTDPITVVSAGAGSGKTRVMVAAVLHVVDTRRDVLNIDDFALITFTNKATDEMRERLEAGVDHLIKEAEGVSDEAEREFWLFQKERLSSTFVGTIHRFCSMILRTFGFEEGVPHETEILVARRHFLEAMEQTLVNAVSDPETAILFRSDLIPWAIYEMRDQIEQWYERVRGSGRPIVDLVQRTLNQPQDEGTPYRMAVVTLLQRLDRNFDQVKNLLGGVDANDLLQKAASLMNRQGDVIGKLLGRRFRYLFVDEFQDTDRLQKTMIDGLINHLGHVLVVGDRKQAIYGFRGADDSIIKQMADENGVPMLSLNASRRPTKPLNEAQSALFRDMGLRYSVMQGVLSTPDDAHVPIDGLIPFQYHHVYSKERGDLIKEVIRQVRDLLGQSIDDPKRGLRPIERRDICLLFRSNQQMIACEEEFARLAPDIEVVTDIGGGFFKKREIISCYYMLQAIMKYRDDVSLDLALGTPFLPFRPPVHIYRQDGAVSPLCDWFESDSTCAEWLNGIRKFRDRVKIDLVPQLLTQLYEFTRIREHYAACGNAQAIANLEKLIMWSREQMNAEALTMQQFFDRFQNALLTGMTMDEADIGEDQETERRNAVRLSTVHASKGLEYPIVLIPGIQRPLLSDDQQPAFFDIEEDNWGLDLCLPGQKGMSNRYNEWIENYRTSHFEEEARIFYVAITRAQHVVSLISWGEELRLNSLDSKWWSWKDEVLTASNELRQLGPNIVRLPAQRIRRR